MIAQPPRHATATVAEAEVAAAAAPDAVSGEMAAAADATALAVAPRGGSRGARARAVWRWGEIPSRSPPGPTLAPIRRVGGGWWRRGGMWRLRFSNNC